MRFLKDVCSILFGFAFDSSFFSETEGIPLVRIRDVVRGYSETRTIQSFSNEYNVNDGDILIGMDGEFNIAKWQGGPAALNQRVCKIIPHEINADYLFFFLSTALKKIEDKTPFVTVKHLSAKELNKITVPELEVDEQSKIASTLRLSQKIISDCNKQIHLLDSLIKARFVELFGDPIHNTRGFLEYTLPELGEFGRGVSKHRPRNAPELLGGKYPLIQTGDVAASDLYIKTYNSTYSESGFRQSKMWRKGTLCITIAANIAKTAILTFDSCFPDSVVGFNANEKTDNIFIHYWFSFFQEILEAQAPESAQKNINLKTLSELKVIAPSKSEQNTFVEYVRQIDKSKAVVQKALDKAQQLFDSLMQEYFG